MLIAGGFTSVGGQPRFGLARLLANGALDAAFVPPLGRTPAFASLVNKAILQPRVGIIIYGDLALTGGNPSRPRMVRLTEATGALDPTFPASVSALSTFTSITDVLTQPNGNMILAGGPYFTGGQSYSVWGILPNGTPDPAFVPFFGGTEARGLVRDPSTGNIYVTAGTRGTNLDKEPVRLLPNGLPDPSFNAAGAFVPGANNMFGGRAGYTTSLAVQPNGRVLLGGGFALVPGGPIAVGSWRLLPTGARDLSYQASNGPGPGVNQVVVQPDGALLYAGGFTQAGGTSLNSLARMLDPNVLSAAAPGQPNANDDLIAWPVPARDVLHLRLPAARRARQAALLDGLGRVVRRQALADGQPAPALPTAGLAPGSYLLRVAFAEGPPTYRRVAVE